MKRRHARQIRRGLELARWDAYRETMSTYALLSASALTRRAYNRAFDRFYPPPPIPKLPPIPGPPGVRAAKLLEQKLDAVQSVEAGGCGRL